MNETVPRMMLDYFQLKSEHEQPKNEAEQLRVEAARLRDANSTLREKAVAPSAAVVTVGDQAGPASHEEGATMEDAKRPVKAEVGMAITVSEEPIAVRDTSSVKEEHTNAANAPSSPDPDAEIAFGG